MMRVLPQVIMLSLVLLLVAQFPPDVQPLAARAAPSLGDRAAVPAESETAPRCTTSSKAWQTDTFPAQDETFTVLLDATAHEAPMEGLIGLAASPAAAITDLAVSVRFNAQGLVDANNGAAYEAMTPFAYAIGEPLRFRFVIRMSDHTYDLFVTPPDGDEEVIGTDFRFHPAQQHIASIRSWALQAATGSHTLCDVVPNPPDLNGHWEGTIGEGGTIAFIVLRDNTLLEGDITLSEQYPCWREYTFGATRISDQHFADRWRASTYRIRVTGTFSSPTAAAGKYVVVDQVPGATCRVELPWTATKSEPLP